MDLKNLTPKSDVVVVQLKHPATKEVLLNEDKTPMEITLAAPHSKKYKSVIHSQTNKRLEQMQANKETVFKVEDVEAAALETLSKATESWNITFDGEQPKLTVKKASEIYDEVFWIKDQVEEAYESSLDFMKA